MRIGIDLGGSKIEAILLDNNGQVLFRQRVPTPQGRYEDTLQSVVSLVEDLHTVHTRLSRDLPVGIGIPGALSTQTGLVKNANSICLIGKDLAGDLTQALSRPIRLANDADCFTLSEATDGAAAGREIVFGVILGTGVGGGISVAGRVLQGANAITGEWGHNPLPWPDAEELPGKQCYCGRYGCIETHLSGPALSHYYWVVTGIKKQVVDIVHAAERGETNAETVLAKYEERLARALASVINVLDPHTIVLGGGLANIGRFYHSVPALWGDYIFSDRVSTTLVKAHFGDSSGVRGAAWLWPERD